MKILLGGTLPFIFALFIHVILWRFRIPQNPKSVLLRLFLGVYILKILVIFFFPESNIIFNPLPDNLAETIHAGILYGALSLTYTLYYQGLMTNSPSLVIVSKVHEAGDRGFEKEQFYQYINDDILIKPRLEYMLKNQLAYMDNNKFHLTPRGSFYAKVFIFYRNLLKIKLGSSG